MSSTPWSLIGDPGMCTGPVLRMLHLHDHMTRQHLRISHSAIDCIDGPTRDPGSFQALQPLCPRTGHKDRLQEGHELVDMVQASGTGPKACILGQFRTLDGVA